MRDFLNRQTAALKIQDQTTKNKPAAVKGQVCKWSQLRINRQLFIERVISDRRQLSDCLD